MQTINKDSNPASSSTALQLLLNCLSLADDSQKTARLEQAAPEEWKAALDHALEHGMAPLFYQSLHEQNRLELLPADAQQRLTEAYQRSILQNVRIYQALEGILLSLDQGGVEVILLKGIYLAEKIYTNIGLRPMTDIDLLVPHRQLSQALAVLQSLGYRPPYAFQVEKEADQAHALPPLEKTGACPIDLHWTLIPPGAPFTIPLEQIWQAAQPVGEPRTNLRELAPEDLLLHLCLHAVYLDRFESGLRPFCDIAWTARALQNFPDGAGRLDWPHFIQRAGEWRASRSSWLALKVAVRLFAAPVPAAALDSLHPSTSNDQVRLEEAIVHVLQPASSGSKLAAVWAPNGWRERARLFGRLLFPAPHELRLAYPRLAHSLVWPLAYLRHLGLVVQRNWRPAWRLARGEAAARHDAQQRDQINQLIAWQEGDLK